MSRLVVVAWASFIGCGGVDEGLGGRNGDGCENYRAALCDWVVRCTAGVRREDCEASADAIVCAANGRAGRCATAIDAASCAAPPGDCELFDVADPAPAQQACADYVAAVCQARSSCQTQSVADCRLELAGAPDCSMVVGVKPGFAACAKELEAPACDAIPPPSCKDVLLSRP
jgi:hypothetical protein